MQQSFVPGTITNKTVVEIHDLAIAALKAQRINASAIEPVFARAEDLSLVLKNDQPVIVGYRVTHAEPAQRKARSDKGKARKDGAPSSIIPPGRSAS